jgi:Leucine-rich repeat (LRR) protein
VPIPCPAAELKNCTALKELHLENNKIGTPVLDLRALGKLQSLQLFGNPLEYLPELSPCSGG